MSIATAALFFGPLDSHLRDAVGVGRADHTRGGHRFQAACSVPRPDYHALHDVLVRAPLLAVAVRQCLAMVDRGRRRRRQKEEKGDVSMHGWNHWVICISD